jgi:hypothetical protein
MAFFINQEVKSSSEPLSPKRKGPLVVAPFVTNSGHKPDLANRNAQRHLSFANVSGERAGQQEREGKWRKTGREAEGGSDIHTGHSVSGILTHTHTHTHRHTHTHTHTHKHKKILLNIR